jgi:signal transduction histidine kinase
MNSRRILLGIVIGLCLPFILQAQGKDASKDSVISQFVRNSKVNVDSANFLLTQIDTVSLSISQEIQFYQGYGQLLISEQKYDLAVKAYTQLLKKLPEDREYVIRIAELYDAIGGIYNNYQKQFDLAESYFLEALKIRESYKLINELNSSYYNLGTVYFRKSQHNSAIDYFKKALASINGESHISLAANLNYMTGMSFLRIGTENNQPEKFDSAVNYLKAAKEMYHTMASPYMEGVVAMEQVGILVELGKNQEAIDGLNYILNESSIPKTIQNYVRIYGLLSKSHANLNDFEKAFRYKQLESDSLRRDINNSRLQSVAKITEDYRTDKQLDEAEETAFFATQRAKIYGTVTIALIMVLVISYLLFTRAIQKKKLENLRAMIIGEENERKRVAKDLHDGIGVLLTSVKLRLTNFEDKVEDKSGFQDSLLQIDNACTEVRRISHNMVPASLTKLGLAEAMLDLFDNVQASTDIKIQEKLAYSEGDFDESSEVLLYRIMQELVNNTLKYSKANTIAVEMKKVNSDYQIEYKDNGIGFDKAKAKKGLGLKSIASRVDILKGKLSIESTDGAGVNFHITIPIPHE